MQVGAPHSTLGDCSHLDPLQVLSPATLAQHHDAPTIYLAVLGTVYDVTSGARHYGRDGPYRALAARDASRILATGDFVCTAACDRVDDLDPEDWQALTRWRKLYAKVGTRTLHSHRPTPTAPHRNTPWSAC